MQSGFQRQTEAAGRPDIGVNSSTLVPWNPSQTTVSPVFSWMNTVRKNGSLPASCIYHLRFLPAASGPAIVVSAAEFDQQGLHAN